MFNYILGKVADKTLSEIVIDRDGIGFQLGVSINTLTDVEIGDVVKIYTYLYVREDEISLYGFSRAEERDLFLKLINISGIGPKMAMQILSGYDLSTLTTAIATGDVKTLCKIKGLGKKTAELIVLNLKDQAAEEITLFNMGKLQDDDDVRDAVSALESLGVSKTDALKLANEAKKHVSGVENIIAYGLKHLAN